MITEAAVAAVIAENVRAARSRRRMRQEDLAAAIGTSRAILADLEAGRRRVTLSDACRLCDALDLDLVDLLAGDDDDAREARRCLGIVGGGWTPDDELREIAARLSRSRLDALVRLANFGQQAAAERETAPRPDAGEGPEVGA